MGMVEKTDIVARTNENIENAKNGLSQPKRRNRRADTKIFFPGEGIANPFPAFSLKISPNRVWSVAHIDRDGKTTSIAKNLPTRRLAEKALKWFKEGKYQVDKMSLIGNFHELPILIILCDWLRAIQKPHSKNPSFS